MLKLNKNKIMIMMKVDTLLLRIIIAVSAITITTIISSTIQQQVGNVLAIEKDAIKGNAEAEAANSA